MSIDPYKVIKSHISTERTTKLQSLNNEYVFEVDRKANKHIIKEVIEKAFKVKVDSVRTLVMPGKIRTMGRYSGKTSTWKKAIVRLKKDNVISIFDNV